MNREQKFLLHSKQMPEQGPGGRLEMEYIQSSHNAWSMETWQVHDLSGWTGDMIMKHGLEEKTEILMLNVSSSRVSDWAFCLSTTPTTSSQCQWHTCPNQHVTNVKPHTHTEQVAAPTPIDFLVPSKLCWVWRSTGQKGWKSRPSI